MIEYLYDAIKASGKDVTVAAIIRDDEGNNITDSCYFCLYNENDEELIKVYGTFNGEQWEFTVSLEGLDGRYFYTIGRNGEDLCFKTPFYV